MWQEETLQIHRSSLEMHTQTKPETDPELTLDNPLREEVVGEGRMGNWYRQTEREGTLRPVV